MNAPVQPYLFNDFVRAQKRLEAALNQPDEIYLLLTGDTGSGKTALLRLLHAALDRCRYRVAYFSHARLLSAPGLIRTLSHTLRLKPKRSHPETVQEMARLLADDPAQLLLWLDEAHELPDATLDEARTLAESDLTGARPLRIFLVGLPSLRERLQSIPALWRRISLREEIAGLTIEELPGFLDHHFESQAKRLCPEGLRLLFERGRGTPGLLLPMFRNVLRESPGKLRIEPHALENVLQRWELA